MSNVVLFGASGAIGQAIAAELLSRGHTVTGVTRNGTSPTPGVTAVQGDAANAADVARLVTGADVVISAIGPRHDGSEPVDSLSTATHALIDGLRAAKVKWLIVAGGAGSLNQNGHRHVDDEHFHAEYRPLALAHADTLDIYRAVDDLDWTYISPSALIEQGEQTGTFRVGGDDLLVDANGNSRITIADYATGLVDQLENPTSIRRRITIGYYRAPVQDQRPWSWNGRRKGVDPDRADRGEAVRAG